MSYSDFATAGMLRIGIFICLTISTIACAIEGGYVGVLGGVNLLQKEYKRHHKIVFKTGYAGGANAGYGFCNNWRIEGECLYRRNDIKSFHFDHQKVRCGHRQTLSLIANGLYDFDFCYPMMPYLGFGLGADYTALKIHFPCRHMSNHKTWFAAQAIAGFSWLVCDYTEVSIDYRYHWSLSHQDNNTFLLAVKLCF